MQLWSKSSSRLTIIYWLYTIDRKFSYAYLFVVVQPFIYSTFLCHWGLEGARFLKKTEAHSGLAVQIVSQRFEHTQDLVGRVSGSVGPLIWKAKTKKSVTPFIPLLWFMLRDRYKALFPSWPHISYQSWYRKIIVFLEYYLCALELTGHWGQDNQGSYQNLVSSLLQRFVNIASKHRFNWRALTRCNGQNVNKWLDHATLTFRTFVEK